ncbi:unnamed protein product, partial [Linum tenue]
MLLPSSTTAVLTATSPPSVFDASRVLVGEGLSPRSGLEDRGATPVNTFVAFPSQFQDCSAGQIVVSEVGGMDSFFLLEFAMGGSDNGRGTRAANEPSGSAFDSRRA